MRQTSYETGYWVARKYAGQGMATEAANAAIRYAFSRLGAKAISIGYFDGNDASRRIVENWDSRSFASPVKRRHGASTARGLTVTNTSCPAPMHFPNLTFLGVEAQIRGTFWCTPNSLSPG